MHKMCEHAETCLTNKGYFQFYTSFAVQRLSAQKQGLVHPQFLNENESLQHFHFPVLRSGFSKFILQEGRWRDMIKKMAGTCPSKSICLLLPSFISQKISTKDIGRGICIRDAYVMFLHKVSANQTTQLQFIIYFGCNKGTIAMQPCFVCKCILPFLLKDFN